jgi:hypothetical protein
MNPRIGILLVIIVIAVAVVGVYYYVQHANTPSAPSTAQATIDAASLSPQAINGWNVAGTAQGTDKVLISFIDGASNEDFFDGTATVVNGRWSLSVSIPDVSAENLPKSGTIRVAAPGALNPAGGYLAQESFQVTQ